jgi:hypothetical protein
MKFLTWFVVGLMGVAMLVALHQCVAVLASSHGWKGLTPGDWGTWVQAIGVIIGIAIAIWVPYKQREDLVAGEEARSKDEARRVRLAIRDELKALQRAFVGPNVVHLLAKGSGEFFERMIPIPVQRFPIYAAMLDRLTLIANDDLRTEILGAYEMANALIACAQENNRLLFDLRDTEVEVIYRPDDFQIAKQRFQIGELQKMCEQMQLICKKSMNLVNALVPKL